MQDKQIASLQTAASGPRISPCGPTSGLVAQLMHLRYAACWWHMMPVNLTSVFLLLLNMIENDYHHPTFGYRLIWQEPP